MNEFCYCKYAIGYDDRIDGFKVVRLVWFDGDFSKYQVYTLKSNSWRRLEDIPYSDLRAGKPEMQVSVNGATHWLTSCAYEPGKVILSFDFKDERFNMMPVPRFCNVYPETNLCSLGGSLCLHGSIGGRIDVWEMKEYGVTESSAKLFTFNQDPTQLDPLLFVKNGEVLLGYHTDVGNHLDLYDIMCGTSLYLNSLSKPHSWRAITCWGFGSTQIHEISLTWDMRSSRWRLIRCGIYLHSTDAFSIKTPHLFGKRW
ncbi:F-box/kelch-repeat protein At3g06240-like [Papaver somniferum]|uniref:F-box/kelch-repeat protein At3g06240-like n=1 Tax=Papaver somniferum TaxID=3469 RepID=UPI000E6F9E72|nr:F-box/kelch-repeat protein At3g06240-like [Papaver somniferum]